MGAQPSPRGGLLMEPHGSNLSTKLIHKKRDLGFKSVLYLSSEYTALNPALNANKKGPFGPFFTL